MSYGMKAQESLWDLESQLKEIQKTQLAIPWIFYSRIVRAIVYALLAISTAIESLQGGD